MNRDIYIPRIKWTRMIIHWNLLLNRHQDDLKLFLQMQTGMNNLYTKAKQILMWHQLQLVVLKTVSIFLRETSGYNQIYCIASTERKIQVTKIAK
jgi:hypothetical protein